MEKYIKKYIGFFLICTALFGCEEFLDVQPESTFAIDEFYTNPTEADIALSGIYSVLGDDDLYGRDFIEMNAGTDEGFYNRRFNENWEVSLFRHNESSNSINNVWKSLYEIINLSNLMLENLKEDGFTDEEYKQYVAEARFLRGHAYHLLTNWWNEVPMPLTSSKDQSDNNKPAASLDELYAQIISDYTYATEYLPGDDGDTRVDGRANKWAAHGLLARLYLKMAGYPLKDTSKYQLAKDHCQEIIASGVYSLNPSSGHSTDIVTSGGDTKVIHNVTVDGYRNHFLSYSSNTYDRQESIFEISFRQLRTSGIFTDGRVGVINGVRFTIGGTDGFPYGFAGLNASPLLEDLYIKNNDSIRKWWNIPRYSIGGDLNITYVTNRLSVQFSPGKYRRWEPAVLSDWFTPGNLGNDPEGEEAYTVLEEGDITKNFTSINFPVLRYADVLLMYAEAENAINGPTNDAIDKLDQVRFRAGLPKLAESGRLGADVILSNKELFFDEIVEERARELCFEGLRKTDLIRWELLAEKLDKLEQSIMFDDDFSENNANHQAFLRSSVNFKSDPIKFLSLPYPLQEVTINNLLDQKTGW